MVIKEGEIRCVFSVCVCVVVCLSAPLPSRDETVHLANSNSQKTSLVKKKEGHGAHLKVAVALIPHIYCLYWIVLETFRCKYMLNPDVSEADRPFTAL